MTEENQARSRIVVGVDGSESSAQALRWAVRQARLTGSALEAVSSWEYPAYYGWGGTVLDDTAADLEGNARQMLAEAVREAAGAHPGVDIRTRVECGVPARVLLDAAEGAALLVVGSRGRGGFVGALLGSVGQHCVQHAPCPVVIVRGESGV